MLVTLLVLASHLTWPSALLATEGYAEETQQECSACHLDPHGGGELTTAGKSFAANQSTTGAHPRPGLLSKGFHLLIGYIHILTAVFWFGTILYVHLVLKPAYAASGLPRGELRVGIVSMVVMGITGAILTFYRIDSAATLLQTRFGLLLLVKIALYLVMVISAIFVITVIGPRLKAKKREPVLPPTSGDLTPEALAACDGKDGHPAYFAFAGKIYDATPSRLWKEGMHMGRHPAGTDLTAALQLAPHGSDKVMAMREVGEFLAAAPPKRALHERVFYFMAYMNLTIVLFIILILALWRWG
jgi:predicted heme/steroid binding protein